MSSSIFKNRRELPQGNSRSVAFLGHPCVLKSIMRNLPRQIAHNWLVAKSRRDFAGRVLRAGGEPLLRREGLQRKAHRKRIGASEDLERKARFFWARFARSKKRVHNIRKFSNISGSTGRDFWITIVYECCLQA
jgi:hypothetical protein